tara:strand:- start:328 stop:915 length:588 start_codon:yes stop_codon:yes gene_type:complete
MKDYSGSVIYTIKTDSGIYVGSTTNYGRRKSDHKYLINTGQFTDRILYKNIKKHKGEYTIEIYKLYPCYNKFELIAEEQRIMKELNANLNTYECFIDWRNNRKNKIYCECGGVFRKDNKHRHLKTDKHVRFMANKNMFMEHTYMNDGNKLNIDIACNFIKKTNGENNHNIIISNENVIIDESIHYPSSESEDDEI